MRPLLSPALAAALGLALSVWVLFAPAARAQGASFQGLGDLPGGLFGGFATGVSADGGVAVGHSVIESSATFEAFRWTAAGGMVGLGDLPGGDFESIATGVSADGSIVVGGGTVESSTVLEAYRWTQAGGMVGLGNLPGGGASSVAFGVSSDGSVVVGQSQSANGTEAFRWTAGGGMVGLGDVSGGGFVSQASGVSADGAVVVGRGLSATGNEAFRWTQGGGIVGLGDLPGGDAESEANAVSADGSVIVGTGETAAGLEAFRWTSGSGMAGLGDLPGGSSSSRALAVSADGSVVVGESGSDAAFTEAFLWTAGAGMRSLRDVLISQGVDMTGWTLRQAAGVSADGRVVVGWGTNPAGETEPWRAVLAPTGHRWIDPTGGDWDIASNWSPATVPGPNDDVLFDLDATYTVFGGAAPALGGRTVRRLAADDGTVDYELDNLTLTATTPDNPSLSVSFGAFAKTISGSSSAVDVIVGYGQDSDTTVVSRLQVFNAGTTLSVSNRLIVGLEGRGEAFVAAGSLTAFTTALGGSPLQEGTDEGAGELIVGNGGTFNTDLLFVANQARGTLRVEAGGAVTAADAEVGGSTNGVAGLVHVSGFSPGASRFFVTDTLRIGSTGPGTLRIRDGGEATAGTVLIGVDPDPAARVDLDDVLSTLTASTIVVGTGGADNASLDIARGAIVEATRLVLGGPGSVGIASVGPEHPSGIAPAILSVEGAGFTGECQIGGPGGTLGWLIVTGGSLAFCDQAAVPAAGGNGLLEVEGVGSNASKVIVSRVLNVGVSGSGDVRLGGGVIDAVNAAAAPPADPHDVVVGSEGRIFGAGTVIGRVRSAAGTIAAGVQIVTPPAVGRRAGAAQAENGGTPGGALQVSGSVAMESGSTLAVALAGADSTQQGRLRVVSAHGMDGSATLGGTLRLEFSEGYAPHAGDTFVLLDAASTTGAFESTTFTGLEPGWQFEIAIANGSVVLNSLSDGVSTTFPTPAEPGAPAPAALVLHPPAPNPTSGSTTLRYELPAAGRVRLALYDALGREVAVLVDGDRPAGGYEAALQAGRLAPGVYVVRLFAGGASVARSITILR